MSYYTVAVRTNGKFGIEFGAYSKQDCENEVEDMLDGFSYLGVKRKDIKIIRTNTARQSEINEAIKLLNAN